MAKSKYGTNALEQFYRLSDPESLLEGIWMESELPYRKLGKAQSSSFNP